MSVKETEQKEEKIVTKYDRKVEMRKHQKEQEKKEKRIWTIAGIIIGVLLVCFIASFPIRTYLAVNETYVKVDGENVSRVEYDYYFNLAKTDYMNQYGSYMSYLGLDLTGDLSMQMYSEDMTWQDFFDQTTVDNLKQNKALLKQAAADGFTYDTKEEYNEFLDSLETSAKAAGISVKEYVQQMAGEYATLNRISKYVKDSIFLNAYYVEKEKKFKPTDEEIENYYQENKSAYDSFDYRMLTIEAELPAEPTDLADAEPTYSESGEYTPSEAEVAKAMEDAKAKADEAEKTVATAGDETTGSLLSSITYYVRDWMSDDARKAGDTTVIENTASNCYYVVAFVNRYLNLDPTVNVRVLLTDTEDGEAILADWKNGAATEESFAALCDEKSLDATADGGLHEGLAKTGSNEEMVNWLFDEARQYGDTTVIKEEDGYTYVMYYVGKGEPEYKVNISNTLTASAMSEYLTSISDPVTVEDPKGHLKYLTLEDSSETTGEENGDGETTESTETTESAESSEAAN